MFYANEVTIIVAEVSIFLLWKVIVKRVWGCALQKTFEWKDSKEEVNPSIVRIQTWFWGAEVIFLKPPDGGKKIRLSPLIVTWKFIKKEA